MSGARGERTFKAGTREVVVLFTNRALAGAEKRLNKGIIGLAQGFVDGTSGLTELAVLLQTGMEAARVDARLGGNQVGLDDAYKVLDEAGMANVAKPVLEAVAAVLNYGGEPSPNGHDPNA